MVDRTDTFLREVDEELRREQLAKLWQRYGMLVVGGAVLLLASIGGYKYWESRRIAGIEAAGVRFEAATQLIAAGKTDEALKQFEDIAKAGAPGYQTLARLHVANARIKAGKPEEALPLFDALGKDVKVDQLLRDYAALQAAMLRLDAADWTEMQNRLTPLLGESSPWRAMAREAMGLAAYKAGKADEARKYFEETLGDRLTPPSVTERAMLMLALLTDAEAAKAEATKADPAKSATEKPQGNATTPGPPNTAVPKKK